PLDRALTEMRELTGRFFDPEVAEAVFAIHEQGRLEIEGAPPPVEAVFSGNGGGNGTGVPTTGRAAES
ncbi:MAG: hypothetical protein GWM90_15545, partial [Gemmatimonadetes bacterium]|nr:hypothetical protein [Gemmatimonadota bacterium]NIQ55618.1 hypothetical protein [Gemmatimonadota bacterium]NIU75827.1 hypothetical protein [Gammaproteobacteria bacterium]NIX45464.1 hypothetical protein [Gemmatimonadota bacterium]NIY08980.1 hypothetical protein [Gemmatimonadota bacterium]